MVIMPRMVRADIDYCHANSIKVSAQHESNLGTLAALENASLLTNSFLQTRSADYVSNHSDRRETSLNKNNMGKQLLGDCQHHYVLPIRASVGTRYHAMDGNRAGWHG